MAAERRLLVPAHRFRHVLGEQLTGFVEIGELGLRVHVPLGRRLLVPFERRGAVRPDLTRAVHFRDHSLGVVVPAFGRLTEQTERFDDVGLYPNPLSIEPPEIVGSVGVPAVRGFTVQGGGQSRILLYPDAVLVGESEIDLRLGAAACDTLPVQANCFADVFLGPKPVLVHVARDPESIGLSVERELDYDVEGGLVVALVVLRQAFRDRVGLCGHRQHGDECAIPDRQGRSRESPRLRLLMLALHDLSVSCELTAELTYFHAPEPSIDWVRQLRLSSQLHDLAPQYQSVDGNSLALSSSRG